MSIPFGGRAPFFLVFREFLRVQYVERANKVEKYVFSLVEGGTRLVVYRRLSSCSSSALHSRLHASSVPLALSCPAAGFATVVTACGTHLESPHAWKTRLQGIAHDILRKWWAVGEHTGGHGADKSSWKELLTDDVVAVAPVEDGGEFFFCFCVYR